jgi:hypothetical protein
MSEVLREANTITRYPEVHWAVAIRFFPEASEKRSCCPMTALSPYLRNPSPASTRLRPSLVEAVLVKKLIEFNVSRGYFESRVCPTAANCLGSGSTDIPHT